MRVINIAFDIILLLAPVHTGAKAKYHIQTADSETKINPGSWMSGFPQLPTSNYCQGHELQTILQARQKAGGNKIYDNKTCDFANLMASILLNK